MCSVLIVIHCSNSLPETEIRETSLNDLCPPVQIDEMLLSHATLLERTIPTKRGVANLVFF